MKAMLLAAGFGTRFRPVTHETPKPMLPLCNRPLIGWAVDALVAAGISDFVVNLHHLPEPIEAYLNATYGASCSFAYSREEEILGTGGGIRRVRHLLENEPVFFVANADTVQWPPVGEAVRALESDRAIACMVLRHPPQGDRYTAVYATAGRVDGIGDGQGEVLMFSGAHALSSRIFRHLPDRDFSSITEDVYMPLLRAGSERIAAVLHDGLWFDIGTPARYVQASDVVRRAILEGAIATPGGSRSDAASSSIVADDAVPSSGTRESVLGAASRVEESANVEGSILFERACVGAGCSVRNCVIANDVDLPPQTAIEDLLVCRRISETDYPGNARVEGDFVFVPISA
ncbi:MAG: nucleotidyltransferase family protein [Thermoanaerobaculia bacterium]